MNDLIPMLKLTATHLDMDHMATMAAAAREAVAVIERLAAENAALRAKVERLTPREMTLEEACDVLNQFSYNGSSDWQHCEYDDYETVECSTYPLLPSEARCIAQGLKRDAKGGG